MEIGIDGGMPTYSGGLGVLAGDTIRSAADLKVPMAGVTLLYRKGYFYQRLDSSGWQIEEPVEWVVEDFLEEMLKRASVTIEGRTVWIRAWKYMAERGPFIEFPGRLVDRRMHRRGYGQGHRGAEGVGDRPKDASSLYDKLEQSIIPLFYHDKDSFIDVMRHAIALNGSFFNTHRMMEQYVLNAYF